MFTPAGKVSYRVNWLRDTNNEGGYTALGGLATVTQQRLTNQFVASASWQATAKISTSLRLTHIRYDEKLTQSSALQILSGSNEEQGRLNSVSLGVDYQPTRSLALGCDMQRYDRSASVFSRGYKGDTVSCNVGFTLD
mgnify:CR=1 FL=1